MLVMSCGVMLLFTIQMKTPLISFGSVPNERYALAAPSTHEHDNEDEYLVDESSDSSSVYLCVLDGHDGRNAVEFVKKYLQDNIFSHFAISQSEETIRTLIINADSAFFTSIDHFTEEKKATQLRIPKVNSMYMFI